MKPLDPLSLPLDRPCLIEASAGTGKTYTMVNLYLRLLLGAGCQPQTVEQILVVTFTKAATQELRDRIREKVVTVAELFKRYQRGESRELEQDAFLHALYQTIEPRFYESLLRLQLAEREIDVAAIYTIDSFCQKMLFQFAFASNSRFDIDLQPDEQPLLTALARETWRELFYPLGLTESALVSAELHNPDNALNQIQGLLYADLPELSPEFDWISQTPSDYLTERQAFIAQVKQHWRQHGQTVADLIWAELTKTYPKGEKKALSRLSYKKNSVENWLSQLNEWAETEELHLPAVFERFCQATLSEKAEAGATPLQHSLFAENQQFLTAWTARFAGKAKALLLYRFLLHLREKLNAYKAQKPQRSFNDMLNFLHAALYGSNAEALAAQIRSLYAFAMIDEFQDTNRQQYEIFKRIFIDSAEPRGFIMIGDPKQSIYKFRGADIFTYLQAAGQVSETATLTHNWRSQSEVVEAVNRLFDFPTNAVATPFLYQGIAFHPVQASGRVAKLSGQQTLRCFLQTVFNDQQCAELCAYQIQQQLKLAESGALALQKNGENQPLAAKDIAVLVRSHSQAQLVREALWQRGIPSVFVAERNSVYASQEAFDLRLILRACRQPFDERCVLAALGCSLWGLSADRLQQLRQHEAEWDSVVAQFVEYQQIWHSQSVLPMLHRLFLQQGIIERLRYTAQADRRITDLLHLTELLQNAMAGLENEEALLRWFEQQLASPNGQADEQKLRLESEHELVKIVTIHGSKGLEYPLVWLPFAAKAVQNVNKPSLGIYRDEHNQPIWLAGSQENEVGENLNRAEFAEELRLLYVALTRAKYQINLILPAEFGKGWNALAYLLSNGETGISTTPLQLSSAEYLTQKGLAAELWLDSPIADDDWQPHAAQAESSQAKPFLGKIRRRGRITSFSALQNHAEALQHFSPNRPLVAPEGANHFADEAQDNDRLSPAVYNEPSTGYSPYHFPHSNQVGNLLHRFFEHWDFRQPPMHDELVALCAKLNLDEAWLEPLAEWFNAVVQTRLPTGFCLAEIAPQKRLNEWQFYLRLSNPKALPQLNRLLQQYSPLAASLPDLLLPQLEGVVRGFIDCVVEVDGRFYLLDYKSNFLGSLPQDYGAQKIRQTMVQYRYDLQYLLYTLALHRYLKTRLPHYDYARDMGGVLYLFLRGMPLGEGSGVFFDKPDEALIDALDELFA